MLTRNPEDPALVRKYVPLLEKGLQNISATMQALLGELRGQNQTKPCKADCLTDLEEMVRAEIGSSPINLTWDIQRVDLENHAIHCTCPHVNQIVMNLARNAVAVMPNGGSLRFISRRIDNQLEIEVADSGPGLDETAQEQLFEPFYSTNQKGTGLGLWITYRLVERMKGTIVVISKPGAGARFIVTLPLAEVPNFLPLHLVKQQNETDAA